MKMNDKVNDKEEKETKIDLSEEQVQEKISEDNLKNFREVLMRENINIVAKLKKYKATDFRRKLVLNQLKELRKLSELSKIWISVPFVEQSFNYSVITVDSSKAGSNTDVLRLAINDLGWKEYPNGRAQKSCHVVWNSCNFNENRTNVGAYVNKFPGISQCLHKVGFSRILETMRTLFPDHYSFYPITWYLPHQMADFTIYCKSREAENRKEKYYIVKPDTGTQGEGIYLIRKPHEYKMSSRNHVVQEYLSDPLLLDGYKFDLRIYVVLISLDPLKVYLCNEGLARFCTQKYFHPTITNHANCFMHLTNYSLNKKSHQFIHTQNVDSGSKRTMSSVFAALESNGCDVGSIWKKLEELVYKTMLAIVPQLKVHYVTEVLVKADNVNMKTETIPVEGRPNCFQILGFDVLIMENLEPLLLEVNSNPSLRLDCEMEIAPGICEYYLSKVDVRIKKPLVKHTLQLLEQEISEKFNIEMRDREDSDWIKRADDTFPLIKEGSDSETIMDNSDKENIEVHANQWNADSDFGPFFVEIAKRNNTLPKNFQLSRSSSLDDVRTINTVLVNPNSDVQVTVIGTSPQIRKVQLHREHERLAKEKSWLNIPEIVDNEIEEVVPEVTLAATRESSPVTKSDVESEKECCLNLISSNSYKSIYDKLRILEETTVIFFHAMGHRYTENMGATAFRTFGRHCKLHQLGFNHAMIDLIYIEVQRRWSYLANYEAKQGLCYQGFLEAFFRIAFARFGDQSKRGAVQMLIEHCKRSIGPENFDWTKTLYPSNEALMTEKSNTRKEIKPLPSNRPKQSVNPIRPLSATSDNSDSHPTGKPVSQTPSKYELMKAIQQMYRKKLKIPKSSKMEDGPNSDSDSVKSLPLINSISTQRHRTNIGISKQHSKDSNALKFDTSTNFRDTIFKTYRYETPVTTLVQREDYARGAIFTKARPPNKPNSTSLNSVSSMKTDLNSVMMMKKHLDNGDNNQTGRDPRKSKMTSSMTETVHAINIRNNMKQLSPVNNERMMKIISVYGGQGILNSSLNGIRRKYGVLKPI